ncbi:MAG: hypothetical protein J6M05_01895 [Cardiobacteriaceae bacterium]|nr:hypothetical protein [Cardiobacteriaceae bacterium]
MKWNDYITILKTVDLFHHFERRRKISAATVILSRRRKISAATVILSR